MVSRAAHVTDLHEERPTEALFHVQIIIVVISIPEILAYRENIEDAAAAISRCANGAPGWKYRLVGHPRWSGSRSDGVHWTATCGISFDAVWSAVCRPVVEERVQVWCVEINTESRPHHKISILFRLVGHAQPRGEVLISRRIHVIDAGALEYQSALAGDKDGQVFFAVPQGTLVVPTHSVVECQLVRNLPSVLKKEIKRLYVNQTCRISQRDGRSVRVEVAGKKVGQTLHFAAGSRVCFPRSHRAVKLDIPQTVPVIKLLELRTAIFAAKPELVLTDRVRQHIRQMPGDIFTSFRWRLPNPIESADLDVWGTFQTGRIKVWRQE